MILSRPSRDQFRPHVFRRQPPGGGGMGIPVIRPPECAHAGVSPDKIRHDRYPVRTGPGIIVDIGDVSARSFPVSPVPRPAETDFPLHGHTEIRVRLHYRRHAAVSAVDPLSTMTTPTVSRPPSAPPGIRDRRPAGRSFERADHYGNEQFSWPSYPVPRVAIPREERKPRAPAA
jgi:hypothetical protein